LIFERLFNDTRSDAYFDLYFNTLIKLKRYEDADKIIKKLSRQNSQNLHYILAAARLLQEKGQTDAANKKYLEAINNVPADEFKIREMANMFYSFQAFDLAIATFMQGRKILKDEKAFTYELLSIYRFKKDKNRLVEEYLNALSGMPDLLPQAENVLSNVFEDKSDYQNLQAALLKKIQKEPKQKFTQSC
jgi:tetratricopeptide (TPR) repeat protein